MKTVTENHNGIWLIPVLSARSVALLSGFTAIRNVVMNISGVRALRFHTLTRHLRRRLTYRSTDASSSHVARLVALVARLLVVVALSPDATQPAYAQVLASNTGQRTGNYNMIANDFAQEFTTGSHTAGYRLTSIEVEIENSLDVPSVKPSVKINLSDNGVPGGTTLGELTKSGNLSGGLNSFEAPVGGINLHANTSYVVWLDNSANVQFVIQNRFKDNYLLYTTSDGEHCGASVDWSIGNELNARHRVRYVQTGDGRLELQPATGAKWTPFDGALMIRVNGTAIETASEISYDSDGDGLIEIGSLAQLNAVRWDRDGDGAVDDVADSAAYATAFPSAAAGMGCSTTADDADNNDCLGYELNADLQFDTNSDGAVDADDNCWNSGAGWLPIEAFAATFEGNSHTIANLYISRSTGRIGLFEYVKASGQVRNVEVRDLAVTGSGENQSVGGIVGFNTGSIVASHATGLAVGGVESNVGGLVGRNRGVVADSYAIVSAKCHDRSNIGGLVGHNTGSIADSYATGIVGCLSDGCSAGGLVGRNAKSGNERGIITASYATSEVVGGGESSSSGGLVGVNTDSIVSSYATGTVGCLDGCSAGGLVGSNVAVDSARAIITASYATGEVAGGGDANVGGLVGLNTAIVNSRAIITASYATAEVSADYGNIGGLVGYNIAIGNSGARITVSYATGGIKGWDGSNVGGLVGRNASSGRGSGGIVIASYATGDVSGLGVGTNVGGLVGRDSVSHSSSNDVNSSYWNTETSRQPLSDGGTGKTTAELQMPTGYRGIYATWDLDLDGDSANDDPWDFGTASQYPALRVDFDGDGDVDADDMGSQRPVALPTAAATDFNGDGRTDFIDFFLFADAYGSTNPRFDLDGNGSVDFADFFRFVDAFGS